ncbi:alpha/beta fold hydrolase [Nocardioides sp. Bht2]|uniref:alpha/beta fold hydrolase n=1 Tax=Nocardioides sp. Bht2 TaxID=3392297 RepID=UPI0039B41D02
MNQRIDTFTNAGFEFLVRDTGPLDGVPVVLLHGFPQRGSSWDQVAEILHQQGFRTFAPDQRGYSPGARPKGRKPYRVPELVSDIAALIDRIGEPVHLVGHDWGSIVAWSTAAEHPESIRSLTAVSVAHPGAFLKSMVSSSQALHSWYMVLFNITGAVELITRRAPKQFAQALRRAGMTPEMVRTFQREIVEDGALRGGLSWYRALPITDPRLGAGKVSVPTTMVWSTGDVALVRKGAELTRHFVSGDYRLEILHGVSHWIPDEAPDLLAEAILDRMGPATPEQTDGA